MRKTDFILHLGDCLEILPTIPDGSIDAIITDLPYGTTACKWDTIIPFEPMWTQVKRVLKPRGAFITTASQPFTSVLVVSNLELFKYCLVWKKTKPSNFLNAKNKPMPKHEDILIFSKGTTANKSNKKMTYNPQMEVGKPYKKFQKQDPRVGYVDAGNRTPYFGITNINTGERYPTSCLEFSNGNNYSVHPTQKPVALYEYLIKTYTNEGETVLDICMGSGTTIEAAERTGRNSIGIEKDEDIYNTAVARLEKFREKEIV